MDTGDQSQQCPTIHAQKCMTLGPKGENRIQYEFYFTFLHPKKEKAINRRVWGALLNLKTMLFASKKKLYI